MRRATAVLGLALLAALPGCSSTRWNFLNLDRAPAGGKGTDPGAPPLPVERYVEYLNNNAGRVQALRVPDLVITCKHGLKPGIDVDAVLMTEKPRNFRLKAKFLGSDAVDLGSNKDEFWFWVKQNEPPYQFYCTYQDLAERAIPNLPMPFQPEWVMEALGLGPYGPAERYQVESDRETIRLVERSRSPQGQPVRKVIVMKRHEVKPPQPQVTAFLLQEEGTGKEICSAHILETRIDPATNAVLPYRLELRWPAQRTTLTLRLNGMGVNAQVPGTAFVREQLNGVPSFNLGRMQLDGGAPVQRARGAMPAQ